MRFLIVTQYYWPEFFLINKLSQKLCELGHTVTVVTGKPNYPEGEVFKGYQSSGIVKTTYNDVDVIRLPLRPRKKGVINLFLNYLSFVTSGIRHISHVLKGKDFDVVLVFAPSPITAAIPAIWFNRKKKAHIAIWVQDLWPQSLMATGYISNKFFLKNIRKLVSWIYNNVDLLLAQSHAFEKSLEEYVDKSKIVFYPNSIENPNKTSQQSVLSEEITNDFKLGFNIVFTGNIGSAQSIPTLLESASQLQDTDCRFVFIGNGSLLDWAKNKVNKMGLSNVIFLGRMENKFMPEIYKLSDALLISLTANEIFSYTIPGKLQAYMAAGRPIIASINGEAGDIIRNSESGIVVAAEDSMLLSKEIRVFRKLSQPKREAMGIAAKKYFKDNFDMDMMVKKLVTIFDERIEKGGE